MTITLSEYRAIIRAGIDPERLREENTFAAACYEQNGVDDLLAALRQRSADAADCEAWNIKPRQWRAGIESALAGMAYAFEFEHDLQ